MGDMRTWALAFLLITAGRIAGAQSPAMRFMSMGFNAREDHRGDTTYFFYGYAGYSEAFIYDGWIEMSAGGPGAFYPNGSIRYGFSPQSYTPYRGAHNSDGYYWYVPTQGSYNMEYTMEHDKLVYWALGEGLHYGRAPFTVVKNIFQNNQSVTIDYTDDSGDGRVYRERYYRVARAALLDIFVKQYLNIIAEIVEIGNTDKAMYNFGDNYDRYITLFINSRTARELAIFRNGLYALKGYRFANTEWLDFFTRYMPSYNPRSASNAEVTGMFTDNERWLLNLVIQRENGR